jgi:tripartite-type tricarboxylate transporter receptor subunit TctC
VLKVFRIVLPLFAAVSFASSPAAADYPEKPVRLIVPYPAGGSADVLARLVGQKLAERWNQQVVVDNRPGAGGNLGTDLVAKAPADGYTLGLGLNTTHATNAALYADMPYDTVKDFTPITLVATVTNVLVVHPSLGVDSVKELIEAAKAAPGKIDYASTGSGSAAHLTAELFKQAAKIDMVHIPYKGGAPAMNDLLGGQVKVMFATLPTVLGHIQAGSLKALAVTSAAPAPQLPSVLTMEEAGLPGFRSDAWFGIFGPAGLPQAVAAKLNRDIRTVVGLADVREKLASQGFAPATNSPEEFSAFVKAEMAKWAEVVRVSGAKVD